MSRFSNNAHAFVLGLEAAADYLEHSVVFLMADAAIWNISKETSLLQKGLSRTMTTDSPQVLSPWFPGALTLRFNPVTSITIKPTIRLKEGAEKVRPY